MGIGDGWAIDQEVFDLICSVVPPKGTLVEFGSGEGTFAIARTGRLVYAVEHDFEWVGRYPLIQYIYAPIVDGWYDAEIVRKGLPQKYHGVLVDGPPRRIGRSGILKHIDLLSGVPIVLDDLHRPPEQILANAIATALDKSLQMFPRTKTSKLFGIIR